MAVQSPPTLEQAIMLIAEAEHAELKARCRQLVIEHPELAREIGAIWKAFATREGISEPLLEMKDLAGIWKGLPDYTEEDHALFKKEVAEELERGWERHSS